MKIKTSPEVSMRMSKQKREETRPEIEIARACFSLGLRYRKNVKIQEVKTVADLVFKKHKLIVFIDGCFWHGCPYHYKTPKTNSEWWDAKTERNKIRDKTKTKELRKLGWKVMRIWEHTNPDKAAEKILLETKN
tara:strand:- start:1006 stop:1407 length:402 start_codon:yes stop_codon:yes gene_type:complete